MAEEIINGLDSKSKPLYSSGFFTRKILSFNLLLFIQLFDETGLKYHDKNGKNTTSKPTLKTPTFFFTENK